MIFRLMLAYRLTRSEVVHKFTCADFSYFLAADELGLWPDPTFETAKLCATITRMLGAAGSRVSVLDFLPDIYAPGPDPEADARAMESFVARFPKR